MCKQLLLTAVMVCITSMIVSSAAADPAFESLKPHQIIADFRIETVYEDDAGKAMGGRFRHVPSGFVLDLLRIQSVPQAFIWVNSIPPSDKGEPHTCEHLLLGKGTKGRYVGSLEAMSLGNSSAFTAQLQTCYHYHTPAGIDVFFNLMQAQLDALLHPNFSDEEIRREVCNVGYTVNPTDSSLRLEEKGTVYNEMVSGYERPWSMLGREMGLLQYGAGHPLCNDAGGFPDSIRAMVPDDMWRFINNTYHLNNMGMIVSIPDDVTLPDCLAKTAAVLAKVEPDAKPGDDPAALDDRIPAPRSAAPGAIRIVSFPNENENVPGLLVYSWAPTLSFDNNEGYLLDLLIANLASGETSNLYRKFIDSQTRIMDLGANAVFGWVSSDKGHPVSIGISNIKREVAMEPMIDSVRTMILNEIRAVADMPDGSAALREFNERARSRVMGRTRDLKKLLNTPPGFGFRGGVADWFGHLQRLRKTTGFRKRLTLDSELQFAESRLASTGNIWRDYIQKWGLLNQPPYGVAARPSAEMIKRTEAARTTRIDNYIVGLQQQYGVSSREAAIHRFKADYDAGTAVIDAEARKIPMPKFISNPPMTLDDQLRWSDRKLPGGGREVNSTFETMSSATVGLAFSVNVVPESLLFYTAAIPTLLTEVGVIKGGKPVPYDDMKERIRREIYDLSAYYSVNNRTERVELIVKASGNDAHESQVAMDWLGSVLFDADWRTENLPRIRDAVDLALGSVRNTMRGSEESWVMDPANAYWRQTNPLILSTNSFLTQTHALHRLRWLLKDPGTPATLAEFHGFMEKLTTLPSQTDRDHVATALEMLQGKDIAVEKSNDEIANLKTAWEAESPLVKDVVRDAAADLQRTLADLPDNSLPGDWTYLCHQMSADLAVPPQAVLTELAGVMDLIRRSDNARTFTIGNSANQKSLEPRIQALLERLDNSPSRRQIYRGTPHIVARLRERIPELGRPVFVGLLNENTRSGVFINSAKGASFVDFDPESLKRFLSARLYGGHGAHSMFMKTWSAGLAYSNGLRYDESAGRLIYYAERCPDLAQTMQFVVNELKSAPYDTALSEYAISRAFAEYRSGSSFEERGEAMAADLEDGVTPDVVRRFRQGVLALRDSRDLFGEINSRMEYTYGQVLPGYGPKKSDVPDAIYFIIGPEKQFTSYEEYLRSTEGEATVYRLYPRDFWLVRPN